MADSQAKKVRKKWVREGKRNPGQDRSPFIKTDMRVRVGKGKKDAIYQNKHKELLSNNDKGSFFVAQKFSYSSIELCR
jgi:hypothetical protein